MTATISKALTNRVAMRSVLRINGGFSLAPRWARRLIVDSALSSTTSVTRRATGVSAMTAPPGTTSPPLTGSGRLSPVNREQSIDDCPSTTILSAGTRSPPCTMIKSPALSRIAGTRFVCLCNKPSALADAQQVPAVCGTMSVTSRAVCGVLASRVSSEAALRLRIDHSR